jgi:transposase
LKEKCKGLKNGEGFWVGSVDPEMAGESLGHFANKFRAMLSFGMGKVKFTVRTDGERLRVTRVGKWEDIQGGVVAKDRSRGGNFTDDETREKVVERLKSGESVREAAKEVGVAKNTVLRIRERIKEELPEKCGCGRPAGHKGWCKGRLAKSPERQAVVRGLHVKSEDKEFHKELVELLERLKVEREEKEKEIKAVEVVMGMMGMLEKRK